MPVEEITVDALAPLVADGAVVLDVREPKEWDEARVAGAELIPLGQLPDRLAEVPEADTVYVICRSGGRSRRACEYLAGQGRQAVNVSGGILAWIESGRPIETGQ